jgi:hypothetical protein
LDELWEEYFKISVEKVPGRILCMGEYFVGKNPEKNYLNLTMLRIF